jgi:hypothetical protein
MTCRGPYVIIELGGANLADTNIVIRFTPEAPHLIEGFAQAMAGWLLAHLAHPPSLAIIPASYGELRPVACAFTPAGATADRAAAPLTPVPPVPAAP